MDFNTYQTDTESKTHRTIKELQYHVSILPHDWKVIGNVNAGDLMDACEDMLNQIECKTQIS